MLLETSHIPGYTDEKGTVIPDAPIVGSDGIADAIAFLGGEAFEKGFNADIDKIVFCARPVPTNVLNLNYEVTPEGWPVFDVACFINEASSVVAGWLVVG